jgi:hypothetical protein
MNFTNFFSKCIIEKCSKKSKITNSSGCVKVGYFKNRGGDSYMSTIDMFCYSILSNKIKNIENIKGSPYDPDLSVRDFFSSDNRRISSKVWNEISKEEFDNNFKNVICDCPVGEGTNIKFGAKYNVYDEFIKLYPHLKDNIEDFNESGNHAGYFNMFIIDGNKYYLKGCFYKKACLNCGKCLSDYEKLKKEFEKIINRIKELKLIEEICG